MTFHTDSYPVSPLHRRLKLLILAVSLLVLTSLIFHLRSKEQLVQAQGLLSPTPESPTGLPVVTQTATLVPVHVNGPTPTPTLPMPKTEAASKPETPVRINPIVSSAYQGTIFFALNQAGRSHLFAYHPQLLPITRLTDGPWDDITPAASPDGRHLAFASNRDGFWDLYLLDLDSGETTRLTNTPAYDASPSWSPDGRWLAYETYTGEANGGSLEIALKEIPLAGQAVSTEVQLTVDSSADYSPAWAPGGRKIAFVSNRSGEAEIWLADLDRQEDRFQNLSRNRDAQESHPAWASDGRSLAWGSSAAGFRSILGCIFNETQSTCEQHAIGSGDWPVWSPDGSTLFTSLPMPNQTYLAGYSLQPAVLALPPLALDGPLTGLSWGLASLPQSLPGPFEQAASAISTPAWQSVLTPTADLPNGRQRLVSLEGVEAEYPLLQDQVDEAFIALRSASASRAGWDFLSSLENAYVPLTTPLFPGQQADWLYTGRAFAFNTAPLHAGWVTVRREDFGSETYWRIYLRARFQDGSMGSPLQDLPWSFDARSSGDPGAYEQGGALAGAVPGGYWLDFTQLAAAYDWERLPALTTWRSAYQAARYNEFVSPGSQDWQSAMLEIYPPEILVTP